jgi:acyl-CoA reductase-like NAD-dependent aldehyde dehydrogenase
MELSACQSVAFAADDHPDSDSQSCDLSGRVEVLSGMSSESRLTECVQAIREKAVACQHQWSEISVKDRLKVLKKLRLSIAAEPIILARCIDRKSVAESLSAEILPLLDACRFLEINAASILKEKHVASSGRPMWLWGNSVFLRPEPLGVVLIIGPSNYPLMLPGIQMLQAIAAGNGVLVKPAVGGLQCVQSFAAMAFAAGVPDGLIGVLPESPEAAAIAIRSGVGKVFLTGSAGTGVSVSRELAASATPSVMELSGCDAVFVLEDADLRLVADCLHFGLTMNSSRTCMAPRRVFASDRQADEIIGLLKGKLEAGYSSGKLGENKQSDMSCAGLAQGSADDTFRSSLSLSLSERDAWQHINAAVAEGARIVFGERGNNNAAELSRGVILDRVTAEMTIAQSDIFAPVLSVIRVQSPLAALRMNETCPYALSATVFGSTESCRRFARRISAGCVVINDMIVPTADPRVPFGGRGKSGHGKTRGKEGLLEMTSTKAIVASRPWFKPHLDQPTSADADVLEHLIRLEHSPNPMQSISASWKLIRATMQQKRLRGKRCI